MPRQKLAPKTQAENAESSATGSHLVKLVTLAILILSGMSLVSQTKVIKNSSLQASVFERFTQALYASGEVNGGNFTDASLPPALDPGRYPPFSCSKLLNELKTNPALQAKDPNRGFLQVRRTTTKNPFYISLHNRTFDMTRWG